MEGRTDADRGRGDRLRRERRRRTAVLASGCHRGPRSRPVRRVRHELGLPGRCGGSADGHHPARRHRSRPAVCARRLPPTRRRLPPVPGRAWCEGGAGRDRRQPLHRGEPDPPGGLHAGHPSAVPVEPGQPELESVTIAGAVLRDSYASSHRWYEEFGELLADRRRSLDPPPIHDETLHNVLRAAFDDASARRRGDRLRATLQMLWADQILETQRQVQAELATSADLFARRRRRGVLG